MIRHTLKAGWWMLLIGMLLALVLTAIRFGFPLIGQYPDRLTDQLSRQIGVPIHIDNVTTRWRGPFPYIELTGIEAIAIADTGPEARFRFESISAEINPWESLLSGAPIFQSVDASGLYVRWYQRDGRWLHAPGVGASADPLNLAAIASLTKLLLVQPEFKVIDSQLELVPEFGPIRRINLSELVLENSAREHQLSGSFTMPLLGNDTQLNFAAQLEGNIEDPNSLELPFYVNLEQLGTELFDLTDTKLPLSDFDADAEVWGNLNQFGLEYLRGNASIQRAWIDLASSPIELMNSSTEFSYRPFSEGFQISLRNTQLGDAFAQVEIGDSTIELHKVAGQLALSRVLLQQLDLGMLTQLLERYALPETYKELLTSLSPSGVVNDLLVDFNDQQRGPFIRAAVQQLSLLPWKGAPGVHNLDAVLEAGPSGGRVDIDADNVDFSFPQAYSQALSFSFAKGSVRWRNDAQTLRIDSGIIELLNEELSAKGRFAVDLPFDTDQQALLDLQIGIQGGDVSAAATLTPDLIVSEGLHSWLKQALRAGRVDEAGLIVQTGLRSLEQSFKPVVELYVASSNVDLDYMPPWPQVLDAQAFTHLHDGAVTVSVEKGFVADTKIDRSWVFKPSQTNELHLLAELSGHLKAIDAFFRSEPLQKTVGSALADWQLVGDHRSLMQLDVALDASKLPRVRVNSEVTNGIFASAAQRLALTTINGQVEFDTQSGLSAKQITADFLGRSAKVDINTQSGSGTEVSFTGRWPVTSLFDWARVPLSSFIRGEIPLTGRLKLCGQSECISSLKLESNLVETEVIGPEVLALSAQQSGRLSIDLQLASPQLLAVNYLDQLAVAMQLGTDPKAQFVLGGAPARVPKTVGFDIDGRVSELDLAELFGFIAQLRDQFSGAEGGETPLSVDVSTDLLTLGGNFLESVSAKLDRFDQGWQLSLSGKDLEGLVSWGNKQPEYRLALNKLHLHNAKTETVSIDNVEPSRTSEDGFSAIPAIDFDIADLGLNKSNLGRWRGSVRRIGNSIVVDSLRGELQDLELNGNASWTLSTEELSRVNLAYTGKDLGNTIESLNQTRPIETRNYNGRIALVWDAAPWQFAGKRMYGNLSFNTEKGRLIEASGGSGLLRLLGILNFNTLVRRLQLDFTDLFAKGVVFDSISGDFLIQQGKAKSLTPIVMKGPSAGMEAAGVIDLGDKTLDMRVDVSLPLVSNTPLAAVLLGAPQIAGALFLIDKLIGDKIEKATAIAYTLRGSWDSPELNLVDNKTKPN